MDAAESAESEELLTDALPWCYDAEGEWKACSAVADRTTRSGVYELQEWLRPDRYYCESRFFRDLVLEDGSVGEAECRRNITTRNHTCTDEVCEQCTSQCTYPGARAAADVLKCTIAREQLGFTHCEFRSQTTLTSQSHLSTIVSLFLCLQVYRPATRASSLARATARSAARTTLR